MPSIFSPGWVPFSRSWLTSLTIALRLARPLQESAQLSVRFNAGPWLPVREQVDGEYVLEVPVKRPMIIEDGIVLEIKQGGSKVLLDRLFLYNEVFRGGFRLENGAPSQHYEHLVAFNRALENFSPAPAGEPD